MRISKLASALFAVLGSVLLVGTLIASFAALGQPAKGVKPSEEANRCATAVLDALNSGNFAEVESFLYEKPNLGLDGQLSAEAQMLWEAYRNSVTVTAEEGCFSEGGDIFQTAEVTVMDVSSVCAGLGSRASELLRKRLDQAAQTEEMPETEAIPESWKQEALSQALTDAVAQAGTKTYSVTIQLVQKDDRWWALPDQALLEILSGGSH